jgi:hypothetical protein
MNVAGVEYDEVGDASTKAGVAEDLAQDSAVLRMKARRIRDEVQRTRELLHQRRHRQDPRLLRQPCAEGARDDLVQHVGADGISRLDAGPADDNPDESHG